MQDQSEPAVEVLKSLWRVGSDGRWACHGLHTLKLWPKLGFTRDYFKIRSRLETLTNNTGPVMDHLFSTFGSTEFLLSQSIVPVVAWNDGDTEVRCIGTGFFVSASGWLITAAHVFRDPIDEGYASVDSQSGRMSDNLRFGVLVATNPAARNAPMEVRPELRMSDFALCAFESGMHWGQHIQSPLFHQPDRFNLQLDIAICKVAPNPMVGPYQPLPIGPQPVHLADRAVAIGYAEMQNIRLGTQDVYKPDLVVSVGSVTDIHQENIVERVRRTPGPHFEFDARIPGKMSGSPIFVGTGILAKGVVSSSLQGDTFATGGMIAPLMDLPLSYGKSLNELRAASSEGMPKIEGTGI